MAGCEHKSLNMKLTHISIHNFRGIIDGSFELRGYSLLVGANNGGKSTVIDAIRCFYEKDGFKYNRAADFPYVKSEDKESWVELTFQLEEAEHESLKDEYKNATKTLRLRKVLDMPGDAKATKGKLGYIFAYLPDETLAGNSFYGAKNVQGGKIGELTYITAVSRVDDHTKLTGASPLRDLLADIMSDVVAEGKAYKAFGESVEKFSTSIREEETSDSRSLSGFEQELNGMLGSWQTEFALKFDPPSAAEIIKSMIGWEVKDTVHGQPQAIDYYGSGFQRHFIFSLLQLGAKYARKKEAPKDKDFNPHLSLLLFEEPEAFLHPPQQEILSRSLRVLSEQGHWQVLCTTHSSTFVSRNIKDIPSIVRVRRDKDGRSHVYQVDKAAWDALVADNQQINDIAKKYERMKKKLHKDDLLPDMEAIKQFLWFNPDRAAVFFAHHVLLVEGPTEVALIQRLIGAGRIAKADCGLYVLDCMGKYNLHRFVNLLSKMGLPHSIIHDDDDNENEHADINQLVADSRDPTFTTSLEVIAGDLERYLGVTGGGSDHRKPQHMLYYYEAGMIEEANLSAFCSLVEKCLPDPVTPFPKDSTTPA